ncbi:MAG: hypothetical protein ABGY29_08975, partial [bacterium]
AADLRIQVNWPFEFVGHGKALSSRPDTVALDVGNRLEPGVLDQHHDRDLAPSTSVLILEHPDFAYDHLMSPWLRRADDGVALEGRAWSPVITTHRAPDFDGVVSALLVRELVEKGTLPAWGESLARFAADVDQGLWTFSAEEPDRCKSVALAFYAIENEVLGRYIDDAERMQIGLSLVEGEAAHLSGKKAPLSQEDWYGEHCGGWASSSEDAGKIAGALVDDLAVFEKEKASGLFEERSVQVPVAGTGAQKTMTVKAAIAAKRSDSLLLKYWVRGSGCPMLICPSELSPNADLVPSPDAERVPRVILSLDPNYQDDEGRRPSLDGLGHSLELEECEVRQAAGTETRSGAPRYENVTNDDPWYDGRGHEFGIVDSPRTGTAIPYPQIVELATGGHFWQRTVSLAIVVLRVCSAKAQVPADRPPGPPKPEGLGVGCAPIFQDLAVSPDPSDEQDRDGREFWGQYPQPSGLSLEATGYLSWQVCPEFYIEETTWDYHEGSDLGVHAWLQAIQRSDSSVFFVIRYLGETDQAQGKELFHKTAARLLAFSADETSPRHKIDELLFSSGRETFAVCAGKELEWTDLVGTQLVIATYHGLLSHLLGRATARSGLPDPKEARHLAGQINDVLARYAVQELSGVPRLQKMARVMREQLELEAMTERMRHESSALDNHVAKDQGRKMEFFLFLLGLMGLVEATNGIAGLTTLAWGYSFGIVCTAVALAIWGLRAYQVGPWKEKED